MNKKIICVDCLSETTDIASFLLSKKGYFGKCLSCRGTVIFLDPKMIRVFKAFRSKGYNPQFSCEGHSLGKAGYSTPYLCLKEEINFERSNDKELLYTQSFRGGTRIFNNDIKSDKASDLFIKELLTLCKRLPSLRVLKRLKYYPALPVKKKSSPEPFVFIIGKSRSLDYFKKNQIKKITNVKNYAHIHKLLENSSRWIEIKTLGELLVVLANHSSLSNTLYIVLSLQQKFEKEGKSYFPESSLDLLDQGQFYTTKLINKSIGSEYKIIHKNQLLPYWRR